MKTITQKKKKMISLMIFVIALNTSVFGASVVTELSICTQGNRQFNPAISANIVVWDDLRNGNGDIYGYDLSTSTEFPICTQGSSQVTPAISGNIVVWEDRRNGHDNIYGYDLSTSTEFPICTQGSSQVTPAISGNIVVWDDLRNGNWDIYGYDLSTSTDFPICTIRNSLFEPEICCNIVVWHDLRNGNWDIYGAKLDTNFCLKGSYPHNSYIPRNPDTNKLMKSLATYRISQVQSLFDEMKKTCTELKNEEDPLHSTCCLNKLNGVTGYLEMAEKFFIGENYIAANYWALKALNLLRDIEECCSS